MYLRTRPVDFCMDFRNVVTKILQQSDACAVVDVCVCERERVSDGWFIAVALSVCVCVWCVGRLTRGGLPNQVLDLTGDTCDNLRGEIFVGRTSTHD